MSRIYLGIHWIFDQEDGMALGNAIAEYTAGHYFLAVPEPGTTALTVFGVLTASLLWRRRGEQ
jgi:hypothetical protein